MEPSLSAFQIVISFFTALNALGVFVLAFRAGRYTQQIDVNSARLTALEDRGSPAVQAVEARMTSIETALARIEEYLMRSGRGD